MVWLMEMPGWPANYESSVSQHLHLWYNISEILTFKPQIHDSDRDRAEKILQPEEQILERVEEEPDLQLQLEFHSLKCIVH